MQTPPRVEILKGLGVPDYIINQLAFEEMMPFWTEVLSARQNPRHFHLTQEEILFAILEHIIRLRHMPPLVKEPDPILDMMVKDGVPKEIADQLASFEYPYFWYDFKRQGAEKAFEIAMQYRLTRKPRRTRFSVVM